MSDLLLKKDILLAEDDKDDVDLFVWAMNELGIEYEMRHAGDGEVLFVLLKERVPYILFLDIRMPCRDGLACIVEIRQKREYDKLPIIMYTSQLSQKIVEESYRSGANLYMAKTEVFNDLVAKLRKVFSVDWSDYLHYPPYEQYIIK